MIIINQSKVILHVECDSSGENYAVMSKDGKISKVPIVYRYKITI